MAPFLSLVRKKKLKKKLKKLHHFVVLGFFLQLLQVFQMISLFELYKFKKYVSLIRTTNTYLKRSKSIVAVVGFSVSRIFAFYL